MKIKRIAALLMAAALSATALTGCNNGGGSSSSGPASTGGSTASTGSAAPSTEPVTLKVACWDKATMPEFQAVVDAYMAKNKNVTIEIIDKPSAEYTNNLAIMLNGGSDLDAFWIKDADTMVSMKDKGQLADLTDHMKNDGVDTSKYNGLAKNLEFDGKSYGLPFRTDYYVLYYNKDLFDAANVEYPSNDMTWTDFEAMAKKLTSGSGAEKKYGAFLHNWQACVENWGVQDGKKTILDADTNYDFFKPYYEMALRMQNEDESIYKYATIKSSTIHYSSPFMKGEVAMLPMGTWFMSTLIQKTKEGENKANWAVATIPHPEGVDAGYTVGSVTPLAVNAASKKQDAAWDFVKFAAGADGAEVLSKIGSLPGMSSDTTLANVAAVEGMPENLKEALVVKNISLDRPIAAKVSEVNKMLGEQHDLIMLGESSVDDGLAEMAKLSKEIQG